jgi:hypothetical protein
MPLAFWEPAKLCGFFGKEEEKQFLKERNKIQKLLR